MGEPIVETPEDAMWCLLYTGVDICVFGETIVQKDAKYRSVLELTPRVSMHGFQASFGSPAHDQSIELRLENATAIEVKYHGSWGLVSTWLSGDPVTVLAAIDGKKIGLELLDELGFEEKRLISALGKLRRASCIAFGTM